ncbi:tripartite tricarboxylate transporter substrate binding protein [Variovorax rhizosphaerae]|uniref:Tripartite tricarboxylate transporter substrate binding protein n=1 Tax=Variovorax rhizosphaerae TaxID=1836200 RepID=A0ABU8WVH2_9BURK
MTMRSFRHSSLLAAAALMAANFASPAIAQPYPSKPITVVVPVAAGGAADALARAWAAAVGKTLGTSVVVDNKPGANGTLAASYVVKQPANGYTIFFGSTSNMSLNPFSYKSLNYNPTRDFDPVTMLATTSQVLVASTASGIKSLDDLVRVARAKPGSVDFGSAGKGNSTHLYVQFVADAYGLDLVHVPYKGAAPAMMGLLAGETSVVSDALSSVVPQVKTGKITPLAIFGRHRSAALPNVPTIYEAGVKNFPEAGWYGLVVPKGTPPEVIATLNAATAKFWADPETKSSLAALYMDPPTSLGPEGVRKAMAEEASVWGPIITRLGIQND